jgi:hypothetical protein
MNTNPGPIPDTSLYRPFGRPLCPVPGPGTPGGRLDAGGARLRLRALHVMGHGSPRLARALGVRKTTIQDLVSGKARALSPHLLDAITDLYEAWWDKRAPERTRAERAAAAAARKRAIAGDWRAATDRDTAYTLPEPPGHGVLLSSSPAGRPAWRPSRDPRNCGQQRGTRPRPAGTGTRLPLDGEAGAAAVADRAHDRPRPGGTSRRSIGRTGLMRPRPIAGQPVPPEQRTHGNQPAPRPGCHSSRPPMAGRTSPDWRG